MTITTKIIADSTSPQSIRPVSVQCRYPKIIHGEVMTHRVFSRNASSSRAIPVTRLIDDVINDPYIPISWGSNKPGMQAGEELRGADRQAAIDQWLFALDDAVARARTLSAMGVHKQIVNRVIEPYSHINTLITSTEWANFDALRCHPMAQPEMRMLAEAIRDARNASVPTLLQPGEWHLPYVDDEDWRNWPPDLIHGGDGYSWTECSENLIKLSVARCARLSYLTHEGNKPSVDADIALYERLVGDAPLHASPAEHQATPDGYTGRSEDGKVIHWACPEQHGNFVGWRQYRKMLPGERVFDR